MRVSAGGFEPLRGVDLRVARAETLAVVGPSGAGKTTLLRLLNGTVRPSGGRVLVEGADLATLAPQDLRRARTRVGFVHQDHSLVPNLRVCQNVVAGRLGELGFLSSVRAMLRPAPDELERVHALLERLGIGDKLYQRVDTLSGGERQRVAIARALFQGPAALVLDEPVASVDPARARALIALLVELARDEGLALVVSLHDLELAREFFPRALGLRAGLALFDGATSGVAAAEWSALYELESPPGGARDRAGPDGGARP